jgi:DnaK suppressor protein
MIHGDIADIAAVYEQRDRAWALANMRSRPVEAPDEDDQSNRYCLDCGDTILKARVEAVQAVRCVSCAETKERGQRLARMRGGATRYPAE